MRLAQVVALAALAQAAFAGIVHIKRDDIDLEKELHGQSKALEAVTNDTIARFKQRVGQVTRTQRIADLIQTLSDQKLREHVTHLTNEDGSGAITSRGTRTPGLLATASYISQQMQNAGAQCHDQDVIDSSQNVVCRFTGRNPDLPMIVLGVNYDARGSNTYAPGANKGGSGIAAMLAIANSIHANSISFNSHVEFVFFSCEEGVSVWGPFGSHLYSYELFDKGVLVDMMLSAPQIAYRAPGEGMQLGLLKGTNYTSDAVADYVGEIAATYVPALSVGNTSEATIAARNFILAGFPSITLFERPGPNADPTIDTERDLSNRDGFDYEQLKAIAQVEYSALLHAAGFN